MHALIVISHPKSDSLTHAIARQVAEGIRISSASHSVEIADLGAEQFDPRFSANDIAVHLRQAASSPDILAEQARIDRADALVLVFPVYWWSMPGLMKGWIDRVFNNGWAYDEGAGIASVKKLGRLDVHLVAIGGAGLRTYARHGYFGAMRTQIDHGIFGYCGARVVTSELLVPTEQPEGSQGLEQGLEVAHAIGRNLFVDRERRAA